MEEDKGEEKTTNSQWQLQKPRYSKVVEATKTYYYFESLMEAEGEGEGFLVKLPLSF